MIDAWVSYAAGSACFLLAVVTAIKDGKSFAQRSFAGGLALLALEEFAAGLSIQALTLQDLLYWQRLRLAVFALIPGTWLLFSLTFGQADYREILKKWKYIIASLFAVPVATIAFFPNLVLLPPAGLLIPLGPAGKVFYSSLLVSAVLILASLERTLRSSIGTIRWQVKFILLGLGIICASWIYLASQALLYSAVDTSLGILHAAALLAANCLFVWGLIRSRFLRVDVYPSRTTIQYSLTVLLAGAYLVAVGLLAQIVRTFNPGRPLPLDALLVLLATIGLAVLLFSDRLQGLLKQLIIRHFRRPAHDYRHEWMELTQKTTSLVDVHELCSTVAKIISHTFSILSVNVWLRKEDEPRLELAGSTIFSKEEARQLESAGEDVAALLKAIEGQETPIDFQSRKFAWADRIMLAKPEYHAKYPLRYALPLRAGGRLAGIITLNNDRIGGSSLSVEDQDLLHAYAAQLASNVLQLRLLESLRKAQELEAFQHVSAFFVHDLKNLASRLSLTMQNMPVHFDNPEFRQDALRVMSQSVAKIENMCRQLSLLRQEIELQVEEGDLNALVGSTLDELDHAVKAPVERELQAIPRIQFDGEQMQKVLTNLVLNAQEASDGAGRIRVATKAERGRVELTVSDEGCGMTQEFIERSLFRPFQSTKSKGLGIGLFHSKMIVEAHGGRIEVESRPGEGSTFRVILATNYTNFTNSKKET